MSMYNFPERSIDPPDGDEGDFVKCECECHEILPACNCDCCDTDDCECGCHTICGCDCEDGWIFEPSCDDDLGDDDDWRGD